MKLSIIIPTLGRDVLQQTLTKLLEIKNDETEIIVVFDNSKKPNHSFPKSNQITFVQNQRKRGVSGARNTGISLAKGDIIAFLGDDTVPHINWIEETITFHLNSLNHNKALLGRVSWPAEYAEDPFHKWLLRYGQFDFYNLDNGKIPTWQHFYTSNISLAKTHLSKLKNKEIFNESFHGWGFEDSELGYRLFDNGISIQYMKSHEVIHHHRQSEDDFFAKFSGPVQQNARLFESLHPEIKILPTPAKRTLIKIYLRLLSFLPKTQERSWYIRWKKAWVNS